LPFGDLGAFVALGMGADGHLGVGDTLHESVEVSLKGGQI
jgi:hypothetical protein